MSVFNVEIALPVFWLIAAVAFAVIEALTLGLITIWFAGGAVAALIASLLHLPLPVQIVVFIVVSVVLLTTTRKIFVDKLKTGENKTNTEALIGKTAVVTSDIKPLAVGTVKILGQEWSAVCKDENTAIQKGTEVKIISIEGVKLVVLPENN